MTTTRDPRATSTRRASTRGAAPTPAPAPAAATPARSRVTRTVRKILGGETGEYFVLLAVTLFLVAFGLVMVLSASTISSKVETGDPFERASRQALFAVIGIPLMLIAARMPISFWKRWAWMALVVGLGLQLLVFTGLGAGYGGNTNWIKVFGFTLQPSELVKLALTLWLAKILTQKAALLHDWKHVALPVAPVALVAIGLVLAGRDLGTAFIMVAIVLSALLYAGVRLRILATTLVGVGLLAAAFSQLSSSRRGRIDAWLTGCTRPEDYELNCWQTIHGWEALARGGPFGVGLGNSQYKWLWLPHPESDFLFAIVGEELGMFGAILVILLFVVLAITFVRIVRMNRDPFAKIATGGIMIWIVAQAFVNIAVVLGILPVLGVPLPLMSAGGSALIATLLGIGVVLSFARRRPDDGESFAPPSRGLAASRPPRESSRA